jgi:hypothetical protein
MKHLLFSLILLIYIHNYSLAVGLAYGSTAVVLSRDASLARDTYALTVRLQDDVAKHRMARPWPAGRPRVLVHPMVRPTESCTVWLCDPADPRQSFHRIWVSGPVDRIPGLLERALEYCLLVQTGRARLPMIFKVE